MKQTSTGILVLGAGLTGAGVALELARRGLAVTLLDRDERALNRASLRNEGKIHLGLIYANDASRRTAWMQLEGALSFRTVVERWIGPDREWLERSAPFHYLVARDSIVSPDRLAEHYTAVESRALERLRQDPELDYLGERPGALVRPLRESEIAAHFDPDRFIAGFATAERALDTQAMASGLRAAIAASPRITFLPGHLVRAIGARGDGFRVEGESHGETWRFDARQVVNATWEHRAALDRALGLAEPPHLLHRLKYRLIARLPRELASAPSVSMVLGRFGDLVVRRDGTAYLSWYPAGLRGWTHDLEPPAAWDAPCRGEVPAALATEIASRILSGIDPWFPGVRRAEARLVDAGAIVAIGASDVDDRASGLHDRSRIGVTSCGAYHSVDPGKLTTAPAFAVEAADRVEALETARVEAS